MGWEGMVLFCHPVDTVGAIPFSQTMIENILAFSFNVYDNSKVYNRHFIMDIIKSPLKLHNAQSHFTI